MAEVWFDGGLSALVVVVTVMELAVGVEVSEMGGADVVTLVVNFGFSLVVEGIVAHFDLATAQTQVHFVNFVGEANGAVLAHGAFEPGVEEFFEGVVTELQLTKVFGAVLESGLRSGAGAAVLSGVIVVLDPGGEFGVELREGVDAFFGEAKGGFES